MRKLLVGVCAAVVAAVACAADLPVGYTEIPYLESTYGGCQWVLTDYVPEWNHRIVCKFRVNQVGTWESPGVFCARGKADYDRGYAVVFGQGGNEHPDSPGNLEVFTGEWGQNTHPFYCDLGTDYEVDVNVELKKWCVDGGERWSTRVHPEFTAGSPLAIFCKHTLGEALSPESTFTVNQCMTGRIYYLRAYDADGQLIHEYVPVRDDNATDAAKYFGFYDTVARKFWPNCSAKVFATDPSVPSVVRIVDRAQYASDEAAGAALVEMLGKALPTDHIKLTAGTKAAPHVYKIASPVVLATMSVALEGGSGDAEAVVIDAGGVTSGVVVTGSGVSVSGLTVRNALGYAKGSFYYGGGIVAIEAGTVVSNCIVSGCFNGGTELALRGGGVYLYKSTLVDSLVADCVISNDMASTGTRAFYGGGVYAELSTVSNVEICGCLAFNNQFAPESWRTGAFRGGGLALNASTASDCYIHDNIITNGPKQTSAANVSHGAGVAVMKGSTLARSLISGNSSPCSFTGVYLEDASSVCTDCTVSSNTTFFAWEGDYSGTGISMGNDSQRIVNCLIEGNRNLGTAWNAGAGAGVFTKGKFLGGVVRGNWSNNAHAGGLYPKGQVLISNVVFDANWSWNNGSGYGVGAIEFREGGAMIRDCWFVRNIGGNRNSDGNGTISFGSYAKGSIVRNCIFSGNTGECVIGGTIAKADCSVEFSTFVKNNVLRGPVWCYALGYSVPETVKKMVFTGCAFWENGANGDLPGIPEKFKNVSTNVTYCYDQIGTGLPEGDYHNLTAANGAPKYANPENGDWSLRRTSGLRDKGMKLDWMGDGSKKGVQDMGDGTWTERPAATIIVRGKSYDVGVVVTRNNAHPRLYGDTSDIGCSEYYCAPGLMMIVN